MKYTVTASVTTRDGSRVKFTCKTNNNNLTKELLKRFYRKHPEITIIHTISIDSNKDVPYYCMIYNIRKDKK
jgi:hypothetical protein